MEIPTAVDSIAMLGATGRILVYAGYADKITGLTELEVQCNIVMPYAYIKSDKFKNQTAVAPGGPTSEIN